MRSERRARADRRGPAGGFTFVEMLVVCALVGILVAAALPLAKVARRRGQERDLRRALDTMRAAIEEYHRLATSTPPLLLQEDALETLGWPPDLETLVEGAKMADGTTRRFLRAIPPDPFNDSESEWDEGGWRLRSYQDDWDSTSWGRENVYDVFSSTEMKALDGTFYKEW